MAFAHKLSSRSCIVYQTEQLKCVTQLQSTYSVDTRVVKQKGTYFKHTTCCSQRGGSVHKNLPTSHDRIKAQKWSLRLHRLRVFFVFLFFEKAQQFKEIFGPRNTTHNQVNQNKTDYQLILSVLSKNVILNWHRKANYWDTQD